MALYRSWIWHVLLVVAPFFLHQAECVRNGEKVEDVNEFRYIVGMDIVFARDPLHPDRNIIVEECGGAILDDYHILTAAHCLVQRSHTFELPKKVKIRLHTLKNKDSMLQMKRYAAKLYIHNAYFGNALGLFENDIAVIKVQKSMNLAGNFRKLQKVELPEPNYITDNDQGEFAGYGIYDFVDSKPMKDYRLRKYNFLVVRNNRCSRLNYQQSETLMCVKSSDQNKIQGMCEGDSGSPLVVKNRAGELKVIGVASHRKNTNVECDDSRSANAIFTRVSQFVVWIRDAMNDTPDLTVTDNIDMYYPKSCVW